MAKKFKKPPTPEEDRVTIKVTYAGVTTDGSGKWFHTYYRGIPTQAPHRHMGPKQRKELGLVEACFTKALGKGARPGAIIEVQATDENGSTVYPSTGKVVDYLEGQVLREIVAQAEVNQTAKDTEARIKKKGDHQELQRLLQPVTTLLSKQRTGRQRAALLAQVMEIVTKGIL